MGSNSHLSLCTKKQAFGSRNPIFHPMTPTEIDKLFLAKFAQKWFTAVYYQDMAFIAY